MKFSEMQQAIDADRYAKASGKKSADAPIREPLRRPNTTDRALARMWKSPDGRYYATVPAPRDVKRGELLLVEYEVVEAEPLEGKPPRRGFEGRVYGIERMLQRAKVEGDKSAIPSDLLTMLEEKPFDDALPGVPHGTEPGRDA